MPYFTPYNIDNLEVDVEHKTVDWPLVTNLGERERWEETSLVANGASTTFTASFIACEHPGGKVWSSLFIPVVGSGLEGFSITWYGKDNLVKGQVSIKPNTENDWYNLVKSKVVAGGYTVMQYIGRTVPLTVSHSFVNDIQKSGATPKLPQMAFTSLQANELVMNGGYHKIGQTIAKNIAAFAPVDRFLKNITAKGIDIIPYLREVNRVVSNGTASDVMLGLIDAGLVPNGSTLGVPRKAKAPEPKIDRAEVYGGGWGGFA